MFRYHHLQEGLPDLLGGAKWPLSTRSSGFPGSMSPQPLSQAALLKNTVSLGLDPWHLLQCLTGHTCSMEAEPSHAPAPWGDGGGWG